VELHGNKTFTLKSQKYRVSEALKTGEATVLFGACTLVYYSLKSKPRLLFKYPIHPSRDLGNRHTHVYQLGQHHTLIHVHAHDGSHFRLPRRFCRCLPYLEYGIATVPVRTKHLRYRIARNTSGPYLLVPR
jgi:hypothetical protein